MIVLSIVLRLNIFCFNLKNLKKVYKLNLPILKITMKLTKTLGLTAILAISGCGPDGGDSKPKNMDEFAQCLTDNGAVMYGTKWCGACQGQKLVFGDSFQYISYVDCGDERDVCNSEGINAYPTWKDGEGKSYIGALPLKVLGSIFGCEFVPADEE